MPLARGPRKIGQLTPTGACQAAKVDEVSPTASKMMAADGRIFFMGLPFFVVAERLPATAVRLPLPASSPGARSITLWARPEYAGACSITLWAPA
jgi:hypothetical protein